MSSNVLISVCIPAFKRTDFLQRLLDSIVIQIFRDFEVVVTDDSPDLSVKALCARYEGRLLLRYYRNEPAKGTPENWNEGIRRASGQWIKIMHDDDWFRDEHSLSSFAEATRQYPNTSFFFSAYREVYLDEGRSHAVVASPFRVKAFLKEHATLFSKNIVGPPSVTLYRNEPDFFYDPRVKWVVDIDFYIRYLTGRRPQYIDKMLIDVGMGSEQVTRDCFRRRPVEIPENFYLLNRVGVRKLRNMLVYDAWWRLMRNLEIRRPGEITEAGYSGEVPHVILSMVKWQSRIPKPLLNTGIISKTLMLLHYMMYYNRIPA